MKCWRPESRSKKGLSHGWKSGRRIESGENPRRTPRGGLVLEGVGPVTSTERTAFIEFIAYLPRPYGRSRLYHRGFQYDCDKYPLPSYAVSVWAAGDNLMARSPRQIGERGHLHQTAPSAGQRLKTALAILEEDRSGGRQRSPDRPAGAAPTQYEVENDQRYKALVKARAADAAATQAERDEAVAFLEELGL